MILYIYLDAFQIKKGVECGLNPNEDEEKDDNDTNGEESDPELAELAALGGNRERSSSTSEKSLLSNIKLRKRGAQKTKSLPEKGKFQMFHILLYGVFSSNTVSL